MAKKGLKKGLLSIVLLSTVLSMCIMPTLNNGGQLCLKHDSEDAATAAVSENVTASEELYDICSLAVRIQPASRKTTGSSAKRQVLVGGSSLGIVMLTDGLIITKVTEVKNNGTRFYPAADAGLRPGDVLLELNGTKIESASHISQLMSKNSSDNVEVKYKRDNEIKTASVKPALDATSGEYKLGLLVKDSTSGIGTLTYVDPTNNAYGSLGHAITDAGTGAIMPAREGSITNALITNVIKGKQGTPGELQGSFSLRKPIGTVVSNNEYGIYGKLEAEDILSSMTLIDVGSRDNVKVGNAQILCTVDDSGPQYFNIKISKVNKQNSQASKGMVIEVTDERLLAVTGGIVQGMSGSPIIQDGCIVGAVTHVMINNPKKGYGVFVEWMLEESDKVA